jgi:hypothetical protein
MLKIKKKNKKNIILIYFKLKKIIYTDHQIYTKQISKYFITYKCIFSLFSRTRILNLVFKVCVCIY